MWWSVCIVGFATQGPETVRDNFIADKKFMSKSAAMHIAYESNIALILSSLLFFTDTYVPDEKQKVVAYYVITDIVHTGQLCLI